jgi:hypothetical protein
MDAPCVFLLDRMPTPAAAQALQILVPLHAC